MNLVELLDGVSKPDHERAVELCREAKRDNKRFFFIGNGGSAAIASHMAADWLKTAEVAAMCFNDGPLVTALANDDGYENVFAKPLSLHAQAGDLLFAISSSGQSPSILNALAVAKDRDVVSITLSGFMSTNPLRQQGHVNFYVPSDRYGLVEVAHHAICHSILDTVVNDPR